MHCPSERWAGFLLERENMSKRRQSAIIDRPVGTQAIDHDRYISRSGLEHLKAKLPSLRKQIEDLQQQITDVAAESREDSSVRDELMRRQLTFNANVRDIEAMLRTAVVIEDSPEYQRLPDGEIWYGCAVSYIDDFYPNEVGHIVLLNKRERDNRGHLTELCRRHDHLLSNEQIDIASGELPLTQALLGHRVGAIVELMMGGKAHHLNILAVTKILDR